MPDSGAVFPYGSLVVSELLIFHEMYESCTIGYIIDLCRVRYCVPFSSDICTISSPPLFFLLLFLFLPLLFLFLFCSPSPPYRGNNGYLQCESRPNAKVINRSISRAAQMSFRAITGAVLFLLVMMVLLKLPATLPTGYIILMLELMRYSLAGTAATDTTIRITE